MSAYEDDTDDDLTQEVQDLTEQVQGLGEEVNQLTKQLEEQGREYEDAKDEVERLEKELEEARADADTLRIQQREILEVLLGQDGYQVFDDAVYDGWHQTWDRERWPAIAAVAARDFIDDRDNCLSAAGMETYKVLLKDGTEPRQALGIATELHPMEECPCGLAECA